ncbi:MAG: S41 family peptidase [Pedobacter sp.]
MNKFQFALVLTFGLINCIAVAVQAQEKSEKNLIFYKSALMFTNRFLSLTLITFLLSFDCYSQITNKGFDSSSADSAILPWKVKPVSGYSYTLDKKTKHAGVSALRIFSAKNEKDSFMPFSQVVPITVDKLKKLAVTAYIKCSDVQNEGTLWCQILDGNGKMIGFQNLGTQGVKVGGTSDWKKYTMLMTVNAKAKKLLLGGYLSGTGTVWFDDFNIEDVSQAATPASKEVASYLKAFIDIVKQNSIYTDSIKWPQVESDVLTLSAGLTKVDETKPVLDYILDQLRSVGDNHSFIQNKVATSQYSQVNSNPGKPENKLLGNNIGYIAVPGFSSTNDGVSVKFATDIQEMIRSLDSKNRIKGWIVDLRNNTGGNMYPMIAGLGPLTGEGNLGYFIRTVNKKEVKGPWFYKNGSSGAGTSKIVTVAKPYKIKNKSAKIAVLIGPKTSSSGEMTAISFIGRENTKIFGSPSGGYTTGNGTFRLSDGATLLLASSITADRNLRKYRKNITPDATVRTNKEANAEAIKVASEWLLSFGSQ